ncbi:MAG: 2-methoxy-6-polyprenyl-1,4-benzoquinol methylase, mitochondrial [Syntrophus sp. SKADARSKE-3]|nr:2-methoxy-6-polyprenyl-1,4-benzoquinol methylase, mitochondrial [Syntrophus sp. SKADARSKE-3]
MDKINQYLMENPEEAVRLDVKTDPDSVRKQAQLLGIGPGARVLDVGCGSGKTTSILHEIIQPGGSIVGVDFSEDRLKYARQRFMNTEGIEFRRHDFTKPLTDLGQFDFIWIRFVLEYFSKETPDIIKNVTNCLKTDGYLCLLDLDYNSLTHYPLPPQMDLIFQLIMKRMMEKYNFDPFVGRKLYSYVYDLGFRDIEMFLVPHHLIYGELKSSDDFNWFKKVQMISVKAVDLFETYPGGSEGLLNDFNIFFHDPRRFTYTPLIICKGKKPL